ncbi:MAG: ATP-binding protein [Thiogranum sp.]
MLSKKARFSGDEAKVERIASRILAPFVLFVVFALLGAMAGAYWLQQRSIEAHSAKLKQNVWVAYAENLKDAASLLGILVDFIETNNLIQQAWLDGDRQALLAAARPVYKRISKGGRVSHLYFYTPERTSFLRVHSPQRYGDRINRHTLDEAFTTQDLAWGVELGASGQFVLRVVKPWIIDAQLVGYIEIGENIEHLTRRVKRATGADLVVVIDKRYLEYEAWSKMQEQLGSRVDWNQFPDELIIDKTLVELPKQLLQQIKRGAEENVSVSISDGDQIYDASVLPAVDARKKLLGNIWILLNTTTQHHDLKTLTTVFVLSSFVLAGLVIMLFYAYLQRIQSKLSKAYEKLRHEIGERKQVQQQLESYSYTIAHDLRAPLRSITSFSQILAEEIGESLRGDARDALQRVIRAGSHMADLIDDILELSRISRRHMSLEKVDLSQCAGEYIERLRSEEPDRRLEYNVEDNVTVSGSRELLYAALKNLLENAWKFTSKQETAKIQFATTMLDGEKVYFVRDNGVGFDMEYVDKLFGTFQRLHPKETYPGTGIGLATVKRVVDRHKGRVWAEAGVGQGATFYFTLPEGTI